MKKAKLLLIVLLLLPLLCSCGYTIYYDGIGSFSEFEGHYELNVHLLPSDDFFDRYEYIDAEYHYREIDEFSFDFSSVEKSIVDIRYEVNVYEQAKQYCLQVMDLDESNTIEYNGYTFIENIKLTVAQDRYGDDKVNGYPRWFNMFAYNDNLHCLVFIGFYNNEYTSEDKQDVSSNWGSFLEEHYSDVYNFSAEKIDDSSKR